MTWQIYRGDGIPHDGIERLADPPPWRAFDGDAAASGPESIDLPALAPSVDAHRGATYQVGSIEAVEAVNAALLLRRPLLLTGSPGVGKSSLAYAVAHELKLGAVLHWPIVSRSTVSAGLYQYDALGRVQEAAAGQSARVGDYMRLGPLGTALLPRLRPRVLLIDEVDKSDIDFANDLLTIFEHGEYDIPELVRIAGSEPEVRVACADGVSVATVSQGRVRCRAFPFIVLTSNGEREFPPAFLRRCVRMHIPPPTAEQLAVIVEAHLGADAAAASGPIIEHFLEAREYGEVATDQLLSAIYVLGRNSARDPESWHRVTDLLMRSLDTA